MRQIQLGVCLVIPVITYLCNMGRGFCTRGTPRSPGSDWTGGVGHGVLDGSLFPRFVLFTRSLFFPSPGYVLWFISVCLLLGACSFLCKFFLASMFIHLECLPSGLQEVVWLHFVKSCGNEAPRADFTPWFSFVRRNL